MAKDLLGNLPNAVPKNSSEIQRVTFAQADMGARESHLPKLEKNPKGAIKHVSQGR